MIFRSTAVEFKQPNCVTQRRRDTKKKRRSFLGAQQSCTGFTQRRPFSSAPLRQAVRRSLPLCSTPPPHIRAITPPGAPRVETPPAHRAAAPPRPPSPARDTATRSTTRALQRTRERKVLAHEAAQLSYTQRDAERRRLEGRLGDSPWVQYKEEVARQAALV